MSSFIPAHAAAWFEIPVSDMERAKAFYGAVLQNSLEDQEGGPNPMSVFASSAMPPISGHLYPGKPASPGTGPTIHLAAQEPLEEAVARVTENGGTVVTPIITIEAGRFAYCLDPDGNSFGLFA